MIDKARDLPARLLVCGFGPFPEAPENPSAPVAAMIAAEDPALTALALPTTWAGAYPSLEAALHDVDSVLLLGVDPQADDFAVEMRACNQASTTHPDHAGVRRANSRISRVGPAVSRSTAPVADMVAAIAREGLPARASSDAGDYLCNYVLYRMLTEQAELVTGLVHLPLAAEPDALARGARAAARVFARALSPRPAYA
jgi:pyroglutamyl-peptidase